MSSSTAEDPSTALPMASSEAALLLASQMAVLTRRLPVGPSCGTANLSRASRCSPPFSLLHLQSVPVTSPAGCCFVWWFNLCQAQAWFPACAAIQGLLQTSGLHWDTLLAKLIATCGIALHAAGTLHPHAQARRNVEASASSGHLQSQASAQLVSAQQPLLCPERVQHEDLALHSPWPPAMYIRPHITAWKVMHSPLDVPSHRTEVEQHGTGNVRIYCTLCQKAMQLTGGSCGASGGQ